MKALITGASSGIGRDMARILNNLNYDIIITARNEENLKELKKELNEKNNNKVDIYLADLSKEEECLKLYNEVKEKYKKIDLLINNAGFGLCGKMINTDLETEMKMVDTNIKALHILTKMFLKDMVERDSGRILNVASVASFMAGPLMATYYATKNYVVALTRAVRKELKKKKSNVKISLLCPGPVDTNFNKAANVKFKIPGLSSEKVAQYAIDKMLKNKFMILPGTLIKIGKAFSEITPDIIKEEVAYHAQKRKRG